MTDPRCALASLERDESQVGTASTVRAFLAVQQEGAWGRDALTDSSLPPDVAVWLIDQERDTGVRPLLIRRHRRTGDHGVRVFAAFAHDRRPWLETGLLDDVSDVTDLDLDSLSRGRSCGLDRLDDSVFLTCTNGGHDRCCAVDGRPVARQLAASHPTRSWECSHVGGDRFAGNVLVLPHGLYYGRVDPERAADLATGHLDGRLDLDHLRGRAGYPFAVQAAEDHLRRHLDLVGIDDLVLRARSHTAEVVTATFETPAGRWEVEVAAVRGDPAVLTCRSTNANRARHHRLVDLRPI